MNAVNTSGSSATWLPSNSGRVLSQSSIPSSGRNPGSNYSTNLIIGNNLSAQPPAGRFMLPGPQRSSFANEAQKSRSVMESGLSAIKSQTVVNPAVATGIRTAGQAASTALTMSGVGTPIGLAMQVSNMAGDAVSSALNTSASNTSGRDFVANQQQWAMGGIKSAQAVQTMQQERIASANTGASIGALFGPIGALIGWHAGMGNGSSAQSPYNIGTFGGSVSSSDYGAVRSANSDAASGTSTMQDNL